MTNFDIPNRIPNKLIIPNNPIELLEPTKFSNGSCSVVYRGKLYIYGPGSTDFF